MRDSHSFASPPPGAGRAFSARTVYGAKGEVNASPPPTTQLYAHGGALTGGNASSNSVAGAGATLQMSAWRGVVAMRHRQAAVAAATASYIVGPCITPSGGGARPKAALPALLAWRVRTALAYSAPGTAVSGASGLLLLVGGNSAGRDDFFGASFLPGVYIGLNVAGTAWRIVARKVLGSAVTSLDVPVAAPWAVDDYTPLEVVFLPPTPAADARVKIRIGGALVSSLAWDAASVLPTYANGTANPGFTVVVAHTTNAVGSGADLYNAGVEIHAAPTVAALD